MKKAAYFARLSGALLLLIGLAIPGHSWARGVFPYYRCGEGYLVNQLRFADDEDDREDAAEELGKIGDPRALPALRQAAAWDEEKDVRKEACKAIRKIERRCQKRCEKIPRFAHTPYDCPRPFPRHPVVYAPRGTCDTPPFYSHAWR